MMTETKIPKLSTGQGLHAVCLAILLGATWLVWNRMGAPYPLAFWLAVAIPVVHQLFVWLAWRCELSSSATSNTIGFKGYLVLFFLLFGARFISLFVLAWFDRGSLGLQSLPQLAIAGAMTLLGVYAMYSVMRYFGMARAAGADHFDPKYRNMPLVNKGIFRYTSNGMYVYAFLLFWAIAIGLNSSVALFVATFSHVYIWVHFYATEKPDMDYLYG